MNKLLISATCIGLGVCTLSGCGSESYLQAKEYLTSTEITMLDYYYSRQATWGYDLMLNELRDKREKQPYVDKVPFCDVVDTVMFLDNTGDRNSPERGTSIPKQWEARTGESLRDSCMAISGGDTNKVSHKVVKSQIDASTVTINDTTLLSPDKVRELRTASSDCNRAKVKLLSLTEDGRYLTIDDYDTVTKLILDCEYLKFENELNK